MLRLGAALSIADVFRFARRISPSIVCLEDIDLFCEDRNNYSFRTILGEILNQMDGFESNHNVITIATTNSVGVLDKAIADRPGRFDYRIEFPNPTPAQRRQFMGIQLQKKNIRFSGDMENIVAATEGFTYAHLNELLTRSVINAHENGLAVDDNSVITLTDQNLTLAAKLLLDKKNGTLGFNAKSSPDTTV